MNNYSKEKLSSIAKWCNFFGIICYIGAGVMGIACIMCLAFKNQLADAISEIPGAYVYSTIINGGYMIVAFLLIILMLVYFILLGFNLFGVSKNFNAYNATGEDSYLQLGFKHMGNKFMISSIAQILSIILSVLVSFGAIYIMNKF
jgi:ABC-type Fe3+ transport system permease subunit